MEVSKLYGLAALAVLALSASALAQTPSNRAPVCKASTLTIDPLPDDLGLGAFSVDPIDGLHACSDADGDTLSLVSVTQPASLDANGIHIATPPQPGQTLNLTYTVKDTKGEKATTTLAVVRK